MIVHLSASIDYNQGTLAAGLHDVSQADYHALCQRGPVRPATQDEIEQAGLDKPEQTEAAAVAPAVERATRRRAPSAREAAPAA